MLKFLLTVWFGISSSFNVFTATSTRFLVCGREYVPSSTEPKLPEPEAQKPGDQLLNERHNTHLRMGLSGNTIRLQNTDILT